MYARWAWCPGCYWCPPVHLVFQNFKWHHLSSFLQALLPFFCFVFLMISPWSSPYTSPTSAGFLSTAHLWDPAHSYAHHWICLHPLTEAGTCESLSHRDLRPQGLCSHSHLTVKSLVTRLFAGHCCPVGGWGREPSPPDNFLLKHHAAQLLTGALPPSALYGPGG